MLPDKTDTTGIHSLFSFGSQCAFKIARVDEARMDVLDIIKMTKIDAEKGAEAVLATATQLIDEAIGEGKISSHEREQLIREARSGYFMVFPNKP